MPGLISMTATSRFTGADLPGSPDGTHATLADRLDQLVLFGQHGVGDVAR